MIRETTEQYKRATAEQLKVCWTCGMDSARSKSGGPLKLCVECNKIGRKVWYCSSLVTSYPIRSLSDSKADPLVHRECQKEDWKKGKPRPHKVFCGKSLEPSVFHEISTEQPQVPILTSRPVQLPVAAEADTKAQMSMLRTIQNSTTGDKESRLETVQLHDTIDADPAAPPDATFLSLKMILAMALLVGATLAYSLL
jgi:hypothetical protein